VDGEEVPLIGCKRHGGFWLKFAPAVKINGNWQCSLCPEVLFTKVEPYEGCDFINDVRGYIVWRRGTGDNTELLHIKTTEHGKGYGRQLVYGMLDKLRERPPYHSVYGFTRVSNTEAQAFYGALGFSLQEIQGVYADGRAVLFWAAYKDLLAKREEWENEQRRS